MSRQSAAKARRDSHRRILPAACEAGRCGIPTSDGNGPSHGEECLGHREIWAWFHGTLVVNLWGAASSLCNLRCGVSSWGAGMVWHSCGQGLHGCDRRQVFLHESTLTQVTNCTGKERKRCENHKMFHWTDLLFLCVYVLSTEDREVTPILVSYRKAAGARSDFATWGCQFGIFRTLWFGRMFS